MKKRKIIIVFLLLFLLLVPVIIPPVPVEAQGEEWELVEHGKKSFIVTRSDRTSTTGRVCFSAFLVMVGNMYNVRCPLCGEFFMFITHTHIKNKHHNISWAEFRKKFSDLRYSRTDGTGHGEETKKKIGNAVERAWKNPQKRKRMTENNPRATGKSWEWSDEAKEDHSEGLRRAFDSGERVIWNKDKTKETDERIAKYAALISKTLTGRKQSIETRKKRGESLKRHVVTEITREKIRTALKNNPKCKTFLGRTHTRKWKDEMSASKIELYKDPKNHPNWRGGISRTPYPFEFNGELKERIRQRDHYICQGCGRTEEEELENVGRFLSIHHIDYDKQNCNPLNLISLCDACNSRANFNRDSWEIVLRDMVMGVVT